MSLKMASVAEQVIKMEPADILYLANNGTDSLPTSPSNISSPDGRSNSGSEVYSPTPSSGKLCGVCGAKALGCNFNAITCESCKAFFRRNAVKEKEFKCPFENNCKIDQVTRRFCQRCRLKKCFDVGMKSELIMTDEQRTSKRRKIEENRIKRRSDQLVDTTTQHQSLVTLLVKGTGIKTEIESGLSDSDFLPSHSLLDSTQEIANTVVNPKLQSTPRNSNHSSDGVYLNCDLPHTMESLLNTAIQAEYNIPKVLANENGRIPSPAQRKELNEMEQAKLQELIIANKALLAPITDDIPIKQDIGDPTLLNVINLTDIAIRRIIKMAKKIAPFKTLCQEDQIALLKGGCTELMILRSVMTYDPDKGCWKIPHTDPHVNQIKVEVLKEAQGNLYEEHQRFIHSFDPAWRSDEHIMLLLSAITLFDPQRPNIVHKDAIVLEQQSYYYLLRRYLEVFFGGCEARSIYLQLIHRVYELHILNENHVRVYLNANPKEVEPLLIEIFDLKSR